MCIRSSPPSVYICISISKWQGNKLIEYLMITKMTSCKILCKIFVAVNRFKIKLLIRNVHQGHTTLKQTKCLAT
jgi:hypothetical protein